MRRWSMERHGRESSDRRGGHARPQPDEVRVRVAAVALNARDLMIIDHGKGLQLPFPFVPASDMAGVVEAVGDRVIATFMPEWMAVDRIGLKPVIGHRYAFDDLPSALTMLERDAFGKVVFDVFAPGRQP